MATSVGNLKDTINNTVELSSICRGEWCRTLESEVDALEDELISLSHDPSVPTATVAEMEEQIRMAYKRLGPDIHI